MEKKEEEPMTHALVSLPSASGTLPTDDFATIQHPTLWYGNVGLKSADAQYIVQFHDMVGPPEDEKRRYRGFFIQPKPFAIQKGANVTDQYVWTEGEPLFIVKTQIDGKLNVQKWSFSPIPEEATANVKDDPAESHPLKKIDPSETPQEGQTIEFEPGEQNGPNLRLKDIIITQTYLQDLYLCSPILVKYVRRFAKHYPSVSQRGNRVILEEPYEPLMHYFKTIVALAQEPDEQHVLNLRSTTTPDAAHVAEVSRQFNVLLKFLEPLYHAAYDKLEQSLKQVESTLSIRYNFLWYIFRPGTRVYYKIDNLDDIWAAGIVSSRSIDRARLKLEVWSLTCDGVVIGRSNIAKRAYVYYGEKALEELGVCPAEFMDAKDGGKRRKDYIARGKQFAEILMSDNKEYQYDGVFIDPLKAINESYELDQKNKTTRRRVRGRVIIDVAAAMLYSPDVVLSESDSFPIAMFEVRDNGLNPKPEDASKDDKTKTADASDSKKDDDDKDKKDDDDDSEDEEDAPPSYEEFSGIEMNASTKSKLTDEHYLLMYPVTMAFLRETKTWGIIQTGAASKVHHTHNPLRTVVIDKDDLDTIEALSSSSAEASWGADFVEGKGRGKIVLLHGPPGVGKTYTVECIAEAFRRPLLSLTMSDLGSDDQQMETQLSRWFALAEKWKAIILVDEADIFLERRKNADIGRNSIVTVFLRKMEYFSGLLFLTTNRVGQIDDAFVSRVSVFIGYGRLDDEKRGILWDSFFDKLTRERKGKIKVMPGAKKYVKTSDDVRLCDWNGREVRNALQTAIALAAFEKKKELAEIAAAGTVNGETNEIDEADELICVEEHHFKRVVSMSRRFQKYLEGVANADEKLRSRRLKDRNDYDDMTDDGLSDAGGGSGKSHGLSAAATARLNARRRKAAD